LKGVTRKAAFYPSSVGRLLRQVVEMGLDSTEPIPVEDTTISPRDFIVSFIQRNPRLRGEQKPGITYACNVEVKGTEGSRNVTYTYRFGGDMYKLIPFSVTVCAEMLWHGEVKAKGAMSPEGALDPEKFFAGLVKKGIVLAEGSPFLEEKS